jgi:hypothetical protein
MMHIVELTKSVHGMYMHEPNDPVEISSLYVFLSSTILFKCIMYVFVSHYFLIFCK